MIGKGIGKEMSWKKFESDQIDGQIVYFGLSFCPFVQGFSCSQFSMVGSFGVS
jgi:hypothetical protein